MSLKEPIDENIVENDTYLRSAKKVFTVINATDPLVERTLPKKKSSLLMYIAKYRNRNIEKLETPYLLDYPVFTETDKLEVYQSIGVEPNDLEELMVTIEDPSGFTDTMRKDKAHIVAMLLAYRYFLLKRDNQGATAMVYYISYIEYMYAFTKYFGIGNVRPNKEAMVYMINNLSYKYKLKQYGLVHKMIYNHALDILNSYHKYLLEGADFSLLYITNQLRSRFNSLFKQLRNEFAKVLDAGEKVYTGASKATDGSIREDISTSGEIILLAENYTTKFFSSPISEKCITYALDGISTSISSKDLRNTIIQIADDPDNQNDVKKYYQASFYLFLITGKAKSKDIHSPRYIAEMMRLYKPGNSIDKNRIIMKDIADKWLTVGSKTFRTTNRAATQSNFRKAIYDYFVYYTATT